MALEICKHCKIKTKITIVPISKGFTSKGHKFFAECQKCGFKGYDGDSKQEAIDNWNNKDIYLQY